MKWKMIFKQAFENYNKAAEYAQNKEDERILLSEIYYRIGTLYDDGQNTEKALQYFKKY